MLSLGVLFLNNPQPIGASTTYAPYHSPYRKNTHIVPTVVGKLHPLVDVLMVRCLVGSRDLNTGLWRNQLSWLLVDILIITCRYSTVVELSTTRTPVLSMA